MPQTQSPSPAIIAGVARALVIPQIPDHELLHRIGAGSYGEVWLVRNRTTGTLRAAKFVHRREFGDDDRPYQREFEGLLKFEPISRSHPSQLAILHVGQDEAAGCFYYVMELADGLDAGFLILDTGSTDTANTRRHPGSSIQHPASGIEDPASYSPHTLRSELKQHGALPITRCVEIGLALASALEHLHKQGLVHRDIKPSNIVFVNGVPKLADIGLVTDAGDGRSIVGTEGYLPPEGPGTARADLFSLGKVLYEAATGLDRRQYPQLPPDIRTRPDASALIEFNEILLRLCAADARDRYLTAEELHADLKLLQGGQSVRHKRTVEQRVNVVKKIAFVTIVLVLLVTAAAFVTGWQRGHTPNPEAVILYEKGRWFYDKLTLEGHKKAIEYLNQAVQKDPKFVQPYAQLIMIYVWSFAGLPNTSGDVEKHQRMKEIADKLMAIDPELAEGHTALSWCRFLERDWRRAEDEIVRSIKLNPNSSIARDIYVYYLSMLGRPEEAQNHAVQSQKLEPASRASAMVAAWPYFAARQFDRAIEQAKRVVELDKGFPEAHNFLGRCYEAQSNYLAGIDEFEIFDSLSGKDPVRVKAGYAALREGFLTRGVPGYYRRWIELIRADESLPEAEKIFSDGDIATSYAMLGEREEALDEIEKHFDQWSIRNQLKFDPLYDNLRDEPRFKALVRRAGLEK